MNWTKKLPQKEGFYWFYGERFAGHEPTLEVAQTHKCANGFVHVCGASILYESELGECWFKPMSVPTKAELMDLLGKRDETGMPYCCPHCEETWEGVEIPEGLMQANNVDRNTAEQWARHYGWTRENKRKFNINVIGLSNGDSVYAWTCQSCGTTFDRFTWEIRA
jgi:hypothetical protein